MGKLKEIPSARSFLRRTGAFRGRRRLVVRSPLFSGTGVSGRDIRSMVLGFVAGLRWALDADWWRPGLVGQRRRLSAALHRTAGRAQARRLHNCNKKQKSADWRRFFARYPYQVTYHRDY